MLAACATRLGNSALHFTRHAPLKRPVAPSPPLRFRSLHTSTHLKSYYYEVLGISPNASQKEIAAAYRQKAKQWHPDMNKSAQAKERFQAVQLAYSTLKDAKKRSEYDRMSAPVQSQSAQSENRAPGDRTVRRSHNSSNRFWYLIGVVALVAMWYRWNTFVPSTDTNEEDDYVKNPRLFEARKAKAQTETTDVESDS